MKKIAILFILAVLASSCDKDSSGDEDTNFKIQPGELTKFSSPVPGVGTTATINGVGPYRYAVVFNSVINGINYVGIAVSDNPEPGEEGYNLKIYYPANSIATGTYTATIVVNTITTYNEPGLFLTIVPNATFSTTTYTVYDIDGTSTNVGGLDIRAVQAN